MKSRGLIFNILALGAVQVLGYLIPLLTIPYITRVLGADAWGKVAFAQAISAYLIIVANWGFHISATRKIAIIRNDAGAVSKMIAATWGGQVFLTFLVSIAYLGCILIFDRLRIDHQYHIYVISNVLINVAFPVWLYVGMEKIKEVAAIQLSSKLLTLPLIFLVVHEPGDGPFVVAISTLTGLVGALSTYRWLKRDEAISVCVPKWKDMVSALKEGAPMFFSALAMSFYSTLPQLLLGFFSTTTQVGLFALADRIRQVAQSAYAPIAQALFPRMSSLFERDRKAAVNLVVKSSRYVFFMSTVVSLVLFFGADLIVEIISGRSFKDSAGILKVLAFVPMIVSVANILGVQVMLTNGRIVEFSKVVGYVGAISLLVTIPLVLTYQSAGAAFAILIAEVSVMTGFAVCVRNARLLRVG